MPAVERAPPLLDLWPEIEAILAGIERTQKQEAMHVCLGPQRRGCGRIHACRPDRCGFRGARHRASLRSRFASPSPPAAGSLIAGDRLRACLQERTP